MSSLRLAVHQFRYDQKVFWRNPASVFFTALLPVIFLVILATIFGNDRIESLGDIPTTTYYIPAIITLSVVSATFVSLAINLTVSREAGLLKRGRGTPLPEWVFIGGRVGNALVISLVMLVVITVIGRALYGVPVPWSHLGTILVTLVVGAAAFCCLGIALTSVIPSRDAASPITNVIVLPLYFLSGIFIPENEIPDQVLTVAGFFPVRPLFEAFFSAYDPASTPGGFDWSNLLVVVAWGLGGLVLAFRYFRWTPNS
ncbi:MAG: ABC transporter permease [Solirubrobacterales bacterium]|nr:ABC transporter permease [Solirubrobacterales bacterium]